jgi:hypothetical protein
MSNLMRLLLKSIAGMLVCSLLVAIRDVSCGGKGKGQSDIILYKNNLIIRGAKGKGGNLVIAEPHHHGQHHDEGHHHDHHEDHHHHHHHKNEHKFLMNAISNSKGKGNKGKGGKMESKGGEMNWEDLIMGGGKY